MVFNVDIGFIQKSESWELESRFFPSKVGGKPAWLDLEKLPTVEDLECGGCRKPLIFLCQIYAPYEDEASNFHRTLFIFVCRNVACVHTTGESTKVFRSHLQRSNKFYSSEPPLEKPDPQSSISEWVKLCSLCGCQAQKHCSKCKEAYCCRGHQVAAWKEWHKSECSSTALKSTHTSKLLFQEFELVIEAEKIETRSTDEKEQLNEFHRLEEKGETGTMLDISEDELEMHVSIAEDKTFTQFQVKIRENPEQVIRYQRGGEPLWISKEPLPNLIPNCDYCQGPRQFELQIMPQMLAMLNETELDWGILCIYTCKNSCTGMQSYKKEFIFKQDVSA